MANFLNSLKDKAINAGAMHFLAPKLAEYGRIERLEIDTKARKIDLSLLLNGENEAIDVVLVGYEFQESREGGQVVLAANGFTASRPWLQTLLNRQVGGKSFSIPPTLAKYARKLA